MTILILVTEHKRCLRCDAVYTAPAGVYIETANHGYSQRFHRRILTPATAENLPRYLVSHQHVLEEVHTTVSACQSCFFPDSIQPDLLTCLEPTPAEIVELQTAARGSFSLEDFVLPTTEH